jgi:small-conductance mechanosensitive channel
VSRDRDGLEGAAFLPLTPMMRRALIKELVRRRTQQLLAAAREQAQATREEMKRRDQEGAEWLIDEWKKEGRL